MIEMEVGCENLIEEETAVDLESSASIYKKQKPVNLLKLHTAKKDTYRIKEEITIPGTKREHRSGASDGYYRAQAGSAGSTG